MSTIKFKDFNSCCRGCLEFHGPFTPLFGAYLSDIFANVTSVVVDPNDNYPQQICSRCIVKVNMAFTFKQMVLNKHKILTEVINNVKTDSSIDEKEDSKQCNLINAVPQTQSVAEHLYGNSDLEINMSENEVKTSEDQSGLELCQTLEYDTCLKCSHCTSTFSTRPELQVKTDSSIDEKEDSKQCNLINAVPQTQSVAEHLYGNSDLEINMSENEVKTSEDQSGLELCQTLEYDTCLKCSHCTSTFSTRPELQVHLKTHREVCVICQKLVSVAHKARHVQAHKKKKKCMVCDKVFADPTNLTLHMKRHYGYNSKDELCAICGKKFQLRTSLHKHMRQHKHSYDGCPLQL